MFQLKNTKTPNELADRLAKLPLVECRRHDEDHEDEHRRKEREKVAGQIEPEEIRGLVAIENDRNDQMRQGEQNDDQRAEK